MKSAKLKWMKKSYRKWTTSTHKLTNGIPISKINIGMHPFGTITLSFSLWIMKKRTTSKWQAEKLNDSVISGAKRESVRIWVQRCINIQLFPIETNILLYFYLQRTHYAHVNTVKEIEICTYWNWMEFDLRALVLRDMNRLHRCFSLWRSREVEAVIAWLSIFMCIVWKHLCMTRKAHAECKVDSCWCCCSNSKWWRHINVPEVN